MSITIADLESELLIFVGPYLRRVGLDGTTADGTNLALRGPIRRAAVSLGATVADRLTVEDADLAGLDLESLLDLSELRTLEICWGNWPQVDEQAGDERQDLSQLADRLERRIKTLTVKLGSLADPSVAAQVPGPAATGLIRAGRTRSPYAFRYDLWAGDCL